MAFISSSDRDRQQMLGRIGVKKFEDLLEAIPGNLRLDRSLNIPALSEMELLDEIKQLSEQNQTRADLFCRRRRI